MELSDLVKERISKDTMAFLDLLKVPQKSVARAIGVPAVVLSKVKKWEDPKYATSIKEKHWLRLRDISNKKITAVNETTIKILEETGSWAIFDLANTAGKPGRPADKKKYDGDRLHVHHDDEVSKMGSPGRPSDWQRQDDVFDPEEKPSEDDLINMEETSKADPSFPGPSDYFMELMKGDLRDLDPEQMKKQMKERLVSFGYSESAADLILLPNRKVMDVCTDILAKLDQLQKQIDSLEQVIRNQKFYAGVTLNQVK